MTPESAVDTDRGLKSLGQNLPNPKLISETESCKYDLTNKERLDLWVKALQRNDLTESKLKGHRFCEKLTFTGKPGTLEDCQHTNSIPLRPVVQSESLEADGQLLEETRKLHIAPLLDHNYASRPPNIFKYPPTYQLMSTAVILSPENAKAMQSSSSVSSESPPPQEMSAAGTAIKIEPTSADDSDFIREKQSEETLANGSQVEVTPEKETAAEPPATTESAATVIVKNESFMDVEEARRDPPLQSESEGSPKPDVEKAVVKAEPTDDTKTSESPVGSESVPMEGSDDGKCSPSNDVKDDSTKTSSSDEKVDDAVMKKDQPENWQDEDYVTRCICGFDHDDGYMISCDKCMVWQHVDCMEIERGNIPEEYLCEECSPREVDKEYATELQRSKKKLFDDMFKAATANTPPSSSDQSNSDGENIGKGRQKGSEKRKKETTTGKRKKPAKPVVSVVKKKKTVTRREVRARRDYSPDESDPPNIGSPMAHSDEEDLREWIDSYEEAITNHYSPELRARISALKSADIHSPPRLLGAHQARPKVRVATLPSSSSQKIVLAACNIPSSQPIIEIRGKYMLAKSGGESPPPRGKAQYIFDHRLTGPGSLVTTVQVDASTYGNSARFLRSSCNPNSQILHCIEKGTLHLYLVSTKAIDARKEVTLPHRPGALCAFGEDCSLLVTGKRRNRKQILIERTTSRDLGNVNNNNYKDFPQRKRSSSSERPFPSKTTKSGMTTRQDHMASTKVTKSRQTLRSAVVATPRRNDAKHSGISIKKS